MSKRERERERDVRAGRWTTIWMRRILGGEGKGQRE